MMLVDLLSHKRAAVLKRWFERIIETYPAGAAKFLGQQKDPFGNPVGQTISREIDGLYDQLLQGVNPAEATTCLENILRIRAVQDFSPSQAVGFLFYLKDIIRQEVQAEVREPAAAEAWSALESRIDELALLGFDVYMKCRERIFEIRAKEIKRLFGLGRVVHTEVARSLENE